MVGVDGKKIYLDTHEYTSKATLGDAFCSSVLDLYDTNGNIDDNMALLCEGYDYQPSAEDKLRDLLGRKCAIDSLAFYNNFDVATGIYEDSISCQNITDAETPSFSALLGVNGNFSIENSSVTTLSDLIRLQSITGTLSIKNNANLVNIQGLSNVMGVSSAILYIDDTEQYSVKADGVKDFCQTSWNIYSATGNIGDDMTKVCLFQ